MEVIEDGKKTHQSFFLIPKSNTITLIWSSNALELPHGRFFLYLFVAYLLYLLIFACIKSGREKSKVINVKVIIDSEAINLKFLFGAKLQLLG